MRIALTGGTGFVGRFIAEAALEAGHEVTLLGRSPGRFSRPVAHLNYDLDAAPPPLTGMDALVHCAFLHAPGRYRGGEGDDPEGFRRANLDGTLRLFDAAWGLRTVFLSSRAVYDGYPSGTPLSEDMPPRPDTLYGEVKAAAEAALNGASLRATGIYGPAPEHKWSGLFRDYLAGRPVAPRVATEVHGSDLAAAVLLLLERPDTGAFNVSDMLLDRHDLLAEVARLTGCSHAPPPPADSADVSVMDCARLAGLGWRPGGLALLRESLSKMLPATAPARAD